MTRDEILNMLDIKPEPMAGEGLGMVETEGSRPVEPPSPTALKLDDWSLRRGQETLDESEILQQTIPAGDERALAAADFLGAAYEPRPQLAGSCQDEVRHRFMGQLMQTEEYAALHQQTMLNRTASEIAAGHFAKSWVALVEEEANQPEPEPGQPGKPGDGGFQQDMRALSAAADALSAATKDVDDLKDMESAMGLGGDGGQDGKRDMAGVKEHFKRLKNSEMLRGIFANTGRYRRMIQAKQRQKVIHGRDDMVGVVLDNDLGRMLPHELACLDDPDLELDAMRRFLERSMMCREYRGVESQAMGPVCVVVDESGSMDGDPIENAKAFALSMAWLAKFQRRWICMVGFSGGCEGTYCAMPPGKWDQGALLDWLEHFYGGGTTMDVPLIELPKRWEALGCPAGKTDVIQITDAIVRVPEAMRKSFMAWKERTKAKYYTIVIGDHVKDGGDLAAISDRLWIVPEIGIDQGAIQELMAI